MKSNKLYTQQEVADLKKKTYSNIGIIRTKYLTEGEHFVWEDGKVKYTEEGKNAILTDKYAKRIISKDKRVAKLVIDTFGNPPIYKRISFIIAPDGITLERVNKAGDKQKIKL